MTGPLNVEAEQQLLGAVLTNNDVVSRLGDVLPDMFGEPLHGRIWAAAMARINDGRLASPVTLKADLEADEALKALGGPAYLARLVGAAVSTFAAADYAREVRDLWARRRLMQVCGEASEAAGQSKPVHEVAAALETDLMRLQSQASPRTTSVSFLSAMTGALADLSENVRRGDGLSGISTGLTDLDHVIGGLARGRLYVLAGRPAMGKSALALSIAVKAALRGEGVFFASLEMPASELATRVMSQTLAAQGELLPYSDIMRGNLSQDEIARVVSVTGGLQALPLHVGEIDNKSTVVLRSSVRRAKAALPLRLVVVDYLQLLRPPKMERMIDRVGEASQFLKELAREFDVPVLALSQLSRAVESRDNKRPVLSDLRDSGQIEQDADTVLFAYREAYYLANEIQSETDSEKRAQLYGRLRAREKALEIIVAKQRGGPTGQAVVECDLKSNTITDWPTRDADEEDF